ncbi:cysteine proteinase [Suhomyces tanzawaensis NRRL Y-17324]|uniref:Ubiquitin carboxyl-terminal hydrolase n=1 Tax=Suhomyces tanzawaensis NRRL Y-17324 TaxID=984487 RepID=A0A1E4SNC6_9ASCO|nr:cysteine proteinase [Suhomyces tanzawaensis NRRL Y-17324]ODV81020.1 cysteine proteinase [Suhomyces tanzawaensis NRRL Y-17324]
MVDTRSVIPLESNPAIFTDLANNVGLSPILEFHDVYSLTDEALMAFLPSPIYGIILLFPLTKSYENYRKQEDAKRAGDYHNELLHKVKWFKQTIGNGCGLYALLHILSNLPSDFIIKNLKLDQLLAGIDDNASNISVEEIATLVEQLESSIKLSDNFGQRGQTEAPRAEDPIELHFITFIKGKDNHLYELDGRRNGPIDLGESNSESNILKDPKIAQKVQFYIDNTDEVNKHNFAIMAIGPSAD